MDMIGIATDDPDARSDVVGSDVSSTNHERPAGVAVTLQRADNPVCAFSSEISAVLKSEPTRAAFSDDADRFKDERGPGVIDTSSLGVVGGTDPLAGRRGNNDVGKRSAVSQDALCSERSDVVIYADPGVVFGV